MLEKKKLTVDCLSHDLLIAKLQSYGLSLASKWLFIKPQTTKVENVFGKWQNIETGVPQVSIFGPLLFYIFVCHLFLILEFALILDFAFNTYFASCADDNTPLHYKPKYRICDQITGGTIYPTFKLV